MATSGESYKKKNITAGPVDQESNINQKLHAQKQGHKEE